MVSLGSLCILSAAILGLALTIPTAAADGTAAAPCNGDLQCLVEQAAQNPCARGLDEVATTMAALGLSGAAVKLLDPTSCPGDPAETKRNLLYTRAITLGRVAVARKLAGDATFEASMPEAVEAARASRHTTGWLFGVLPIYDDAFERVMCGLAQDRIVMGQINLAERLVGNVAAPSPSFVSACLGRLAGILYQLGKGDEAAAFLHDARAALPWSDADRAHGLEGIARGLSLASQCVRFL